MMNLNNNFEFNLQVEFNSFKLKFEDYSEKFEVYVKEQQRNINILREHTDRSLDTLTTREVKPTDKFIHQEEMNLNNNKEKFSIIKNKIVEMEKYINTIGDADNFDKVMGSINALKLSLASFSNTEYPFPSVIPSDSPFVQHAVISLYIQNQWINGEFATLDAQRIRFSETVSAEFDILNEPQIPDCFGYNNESMLIEYVTAMDSVNSCYMGDDAMSSLFPAYPACDIYLGYPHYA
ncbi:hypothetical protein [Providencia sp. PROV202]|uniref:hypothetical protein n=1 Tax=Providencia sp. PROV202 TaxID=2949902 RepID=UPI002349FBE5|nr:hypothetical protein [Providencia sp. PROV202]